METHPPTKQTQQQPNNSNRQQHLAPTKQTTHQTKKTNTSSPLSPDPSSFELVSDELRDRVLTMDELHYCAQG